MRTIIVSSKIGGSFLHKIVIDVGVRKVFKS